MSHSLHLEASTRRLTRAQVDLNAIAHNVACLRALIKGAPPPRIWATVKGDAYGHGIANVVDGLARVDGLAVSHEAERQACRKAGWRGSILMLNGLSSIDGAQPLHDPDIHLVIHDPSQLAWLGAHSLDHPPSIWLRYVGDLHYIGMNTRTYRQAYELADAMRRAGRVRLVGHFNHYARADDQDGIDTARHQFMQAIRDLPGPISASNSAALLQQRNHATTDDWVRPGLMLYGASPLAQYTGPQLGLRPALSLQSELIATLTLPGNTPMGYGGAFVSTRAMPVGIVPCGYSHGYPRQANTGTPVLVNGIQTRLLGHACMDLMAVDLSPIPDAEPGMPVTLWGTDALPAESVARHAGTIAAALFTGLTANVPIHVIPIAA